MKIEELKEKLTFTRAFFIAMLLIYLAVALTDFSKFMILINSFAGIIVKVLPVFFLVFVLMLLVNYFISPKTVIRHFHKGSGLRGWLIMVVGGILSSGPIYMWYPLLADLKKRGVKQGFIATFLYNRAIKLPLMPLFLIYFDFNLLAILTIVMIVFSVIQGLLINYLEDEKIL